MSKIYVYGDNVDTDVIIAARYLNDPDERNLAAHCMEDIDPQFSSTVEAGDIHCGRCQLWLRLIPRARTAGYQGQRRQMRHCRLLCPYFLPQRHQYRFSHHGVPGGCR